MSFTMAKFAEHQAEEVVDNGRSYRRCNAGDRQFIYYACRASLKDGILERGIFVRLSKQLGVTHETVSRQWAGMLFKAAALLDNHHIKEHNNILAS